jgi:hypothetical protein
MKKTLLSIGFLAFTLCSFAQVLESENFNSLTIGNVGTAFDGATPGQGGFLTFSTNNGATGVPVTSTNAGNTNFQIVAGGEAASNGFALTTPNATTGSRFMWKTGLDAAWVNRTAGNNVIEVEYSFNTGAASTSGTRHGMLLYTAAFEGIVGFSYQTDTRVLRGIARLTSNGAPGNFVITLGAGNTPLVLANNTWYRIGCSYNTVTGEVLWRTSPTDAPLTVAAANYLPGLVPAELDFVGTVVAASTTSVPPQPANASASTVIFDNYRVRATPVSDLLGVDEVLNAGVTIKLFPNPSTDLVNVTSDLEAVNAIQILDLNGRLVKENNTGGFEVVTNIADLVSGMYIINITTDSGSVSRKFIKQ